MVCSKNHNNRPIEEFVLVSPAPVDTAAKLSNILTVLSNKEKERAKDLIAAGKFCETMATELLALGIVNSCFLFKKICLIIVM